MRTVVILTLSMMMAPLASAVEQSAGMVNNPDGETMSYPDTGLRVGTVEWRGDIMWQYTGMAKYSIFPTEESVERFIDQQATGEPKPSRRDRIIGSVRVDGYGQEWVAIDVEFSTPDTFYDLIGGDDNDPEGLEDNEDFVGWYKPQSWTGITCSNGNFIALEGIESRTLWSSLSANRHYREVKITMNNPGGGTETCTGTQVGPRDILTSAHCLTDNNTNWNTVSAICSRGNNSGYTGADCISDPQGGFNLSRPSGFVDDNSEPQDDYGMIQWLGSPNSADDEVLTGLGSTSWELSTLSNSGIEAEDLALYAFHLDYAPDETNCTAANGTSAADPDQNAFHKKLVKEWDDAADNRHWVTTSLLKTNHDCSDGSSGGAYFVCDPSTNDCANGEELVGLHAGTWDPPFGAIYCGGPKTAVYADFVNTNL